MLVIMSCVSGLPTIMTVGAVIFTAPEFPSVSKDSVEMLERCKDTLVVPAQLHRTSACCDWGYAVSRDTCSDKTPLFQRHDRSHEGHCAAISIRKKGSRGDNRPCETDAGGASEGHIPPLLVVVPSLSALANRKVSCKLTCDPATVITPAFPPARNELVSTDKFVKDALSVVEIVTAPPWPMLPIAGPVRIWASVATN